MYKLNKTLTLTFAQQDFFFKLLPLSALLQEWIIGKCQFKGKIQSEHGIFAPLLAADLIILSDIGEHPIAKAEYGRRYSNNLAVLEAGTVWGGKTNKHDGKVYRSYRDWREFAVDWSDHISFSGLYDHILVEPTLNNQANLLACQRGMITVDKLNEVIKDFKLLEQPHVKKTESKRNS